MNISDELVPLWNKPRLSMKRMAQNIENAREKRTKRGGEEQENDEGEKRLEGIIQAKCKAKRKKSIRGSSTSRN